MRLPDKSCGSGANLSAGDCPELHDRGSAPGYVTDARSPSVRKVSSVVVENLGKSARVTQPFMLDRNSKL